MEELLKKLPENLRGELAAKAAKCADAEALTALAKEYGLELGTEELEACRKFFSAEKSELSDELMEKISGGWCDTHDTGCDD